MAKRFFDIVFSLLGLLAIGCFFLFVFWILASIDTRFNGVVVKERIGV